MARCFFSFPAFRTSPSYAAHSFGRSAHYGTPKAVLHPGAEFTCSDWCGLLVLFVVKAVFHVADAAFFYGTADFFFAGVKFGTTGFYFY